MQDDATGKILAARFFSLGNHIRLSLLASPTAPLSCSTSFLRRSRRHLRPQRRLLDRRRTTRWKTPAHPVRPRSGTTGRHLDRRQPPAGQRPGRAPLGCVARSPQQRTAAGQSGRHRLRQRVAPRSGKPRAHLVFRARTNRQQTITSCGGKAASSKSPSRPAALALPALRYSSTRLSTAASPSTTATRACGTPASQGRERFMLPLG